MRRSKHGCFSRNHFNSGLAYHCLFRKSCSLGHSGEFILRISLLVEQGGKVAMVDPRRRRFGHGGFGMEGDGESRFAEHG